MEKINKQILILIQKTLQKYELLISNKDFAQMAGISEKTLKKVLSGNAKLNDSIKVCKLLHIELNLNFKII